MARRKIRKFNSISYYENLLSEYFNNNRYIIVENLIKETGYENLEKLTEDEFKMAFGFDCGLVYLQPKSKEMRHEWELDNGKYNDRLFVSHNLPYNSQSTTIQMIETEKAVNDLELNNLFDIKIWLD